ncbi:MAG: flavodoxin family protein [Desulfitobacterium hafniense]|nr:flavodoxin family protein [Desulfosporosinus sp.]MDA8226500.1 flavodoxin family protein [Desulfitobacterium hafniense]
MKILAINGSPRKNKTTATLLDYALHGAASIGVETEMVNLYDLNYKGCVSCFACKLKDGKSCGKCAYRDDLSPLLEKAIAADVILLGSPIYYDFVTGEMRSFMERLMFPIDTYAIDTNTGRRRRLLNKVIPVGFIYTMNANESQMKHAEYPKILSCNERALSRLFGYCETMFSMDTYQFNDYSKYDVSLFDEKHKAEVREKQFPIDCQKAFDLGIKLIGEAKKMH